MIVPGFSLVSNDTTCRRNLLGTFVIGMAGTE